MAKKAPSSRKFLHKFIEGDSLVSLVFDLNEKPLREIIFSNNSICNTYWINNSMRGFYAHHYLALSNANLLNKNPFNNIVQIFNHQYGAITQIIPLTLIILNNNLNVQIFNCCMG